MRSNILQYKFHFFISYRYCFNFEKILCKKYFRIKISNKIVMLIYSPFLISLTSRNHYTPILHLLNLLLEFIIFLISSFPRKYATRNFKNDYIFSLPNFHRDLISLVIIQIVSQRRAAISLSVYAWVTEFKA